MQDDKCGNVGFACGFQSPRFQRFAEHFVCEREFCCYFWADGAGTSHAARKAAATSPLRGALCLCGFGTCCVTARWGSSSMRRRFDVFVSAAWFPALRAEQSRLICLPIKLCIQYVSCALLLILPKTSATFMSGVCRLGLRRRLILRMRLSRLMRGRNMARRAMLRWAICADGYMFCASRKRLMAFASSVFARPMIER